MIKAGTRDRSLALFIISLLLSTVVAAQTPATNQSKTEPENPQKVSSQQTKETDEQIPEDIVIPPAPNIIKRESNVISIPIDADEDESESKYEEKPIASTNVKVNSRYGYRRDPFTRRSKFHSGVDLKAVWGDPIGASLAGTVQSAKWHRGYGNLVVIDHGGGVTTYYAHLSSFEVQEGDRVNRGTIVGYAGRTGRATSPHLHYELRFDGRPVNPLRTLALDSTSDFFKQSNASSDNAGEEAKPVASPDGSN